MNDVRKPPVGAVLRLHQQGVRGWCGWCGLAVADKTEARGWLKWWHDACAFEMGIIENPSHARDAVFARDQGVCCDCKEDWSERYVFRKGGIIHTSPMWEQIRQKPAEQEYWGERNDGFWVYTELVWVSLWHVDHKTPLWKVRHMPDLQRLEYFKLANLITRCHRCHEFKTTEEAADRAKIKRAVNTPPPKPKSKWASRKMVGRGFPPKGSRPMRRKP